MTVPLGKIDHLARRDEQLRDFRLQGLETRKAGGPLLIGHEHPFSAAE
jgi:hypothetical protein